MSTYLVGDIHGCYTELKKILSIVNYNPSIDSLWLTGDLITRGPDSLKVLRFVRNLGNSVNMVLGNHDLQLLSIYGNIKNNKNQFTTLLAEPDINKIINWLRQQPILQINEEKKIIMSHAGITPQWDIDITKKCAQEIENILKSDRYSFFLNKINRDIPNNWSNKLKGISRLQFSVNVFTRMRFCFSNGQLDMKYKKISNETPKSLHPWFLLPGLVSKKYNIIFGHWASLKDIKMPPGIYNLDTGCCWGEKLTLLHWEKKEFIYVPCKKYC